MQRLRVLVGPSMEAPGTQSDESGLELEFSGYLSQRRFSCRITFYRLLGEVILLGQQIFGPAVFKLTTTGSYELSPPIILNGNFQAHLSFSFHSLLHCRTEICLLLSYCRVVVVLSPSSLHSFFGIPVVGGFNNVINEHFTSFMTICY